MRPDTPAAARAVETGTTSTAAGGSGDVVPGQDAETVQTAVGAVRIPPKPTRPPRRRAPKLDELLAGAVDQARAALTVETGLAEPAQVGDHVGAVADDDRLVTHRFAASLPGYGGWEWFATLARAPRSKVVTVCEVGLLPGADAVLAPAWVPWSERVSQEEKIRLDAIAAGEDPEKAIARARGEQAGDDSSEDAHGVQGVPAGQAAGPAQEGASQDATEADEADEADQADEATDAAAVDAGSDAADADAGDEDAAGAGERHPRP